MKGSNPAEVELGRPLTLSHPRNRPPFRAKKHEFATLHRVQHPVGRYPEVLSVGEAERQARTILGGDHVLRLGRLGDQREVGHQFAPPSEVAGDRDALQVRASLRKRRLRVLKQGGCAVQMQSAFSASRDGQVLQNLGLHRGAEALGLPDAVVLGGVLKLGERAIPRSL